MAASLLPTGDEKEIITYCFSRGYEYDAIVHFLAKFPDITMSIRTLKNRLRRYQLRRRTPTYDLNLVREAILRELIGPGCSGGYRSMWHTLHLHNIQVPRHVVEHPRHHESLLCTVKIVLYLESLLCTVKICFESRKIVVHRVELFCITKNCCAP